MNTTNTPHEIEYPLVSVVTPSYNAMPFIKDTIESIRSQDYPKIEHIVIDGGSNDGTVEILKGCPQLRWISEPDRGQSDALNKGFRLAQGEVIGWLNADDTYRPGAISHAIEYFQAHPDVDLVYTDIQVIDENDQPVRFVKAAPFSLEMLLQRNIINQPTVFMRRQVLDTLGGVDNNIQFYVMDRELWLRAGMLFNLHYIPGVVFANFRFCKGTLSHENPAAFHKAWLRVLDDFEKSPNLDRNILIAIERARQLSTKQYYFALMVQASNNGRQMEAMSAFQKATSYDWRILFQFGVWKLLFKVFIRNRISYLKGLRFHPGGSKQL